MPVSVTHSEEVKIISDPYAAYTRAVIHRTETWREIQISLSHVLETNETYLHNRNI